MTISGRDDTWTPTNAHISYVIVAGMACHTFQYPKYLNQLTQSEMYIALALQLCSCNLVCESCMSCAVTLQGHEAAPTLAAVTKLILGKQTAAHAGSVNHNQCTTLVWHCPNIYMWMFWNFSCAWASCAPLIASCDFAWSYCC